MLIKKTKAAILHRQNEPLIVDEVKLPDKLDYGQILVHVHFSGICGSQLGEIAGVKGDDPYLPHLLGHEGVGEVLQIGPSVDHIKVGENVVMHWKPGIGIQAKPPKYAWNNQILNAGYVTTFNEYAVVSENRLTPLPTNYSIENASLYGCALTTGLGVIENNAQIKMGESIVVLGSGGVGLNIIQGASLHSAYPIIAVDRFDNRLNLAKELGATHLINNKKNSDWIQKIRVILGKDGPDVVVDNTGNPKVISECYDLTKSKGRFILVGVPPSSSTVQIYTLPLHFGKKLSGSHGGDGNPSEDIPRYLKLEELGLLKLNQIFTERFNLNDINSAIERMRDGSLVGRALIEFS